MSSVYLINVGANTKDSAKARSPIFEDGSFIYVSFSTKSSQGPPGYPPKCLPFLRGVDLFNTHPDPDWVNLTYGDNCSNFRAAALKRVEKGDVLLFWGLLWQNSGTDWSGFTEKRGWYLIGTLRVEEIAEPGQALQQVSQANRNRAGKNAHFVRNSGVLPSTDRVFIGSPLYSNCFARAVDLEVISSEGLMYRAFPSAKGYLLALNGKPHWRSSLRPCRKIWDLSDSIARARAMIVRDAVRYQNGIDFLADI
jgi:hypothetical protein